jgi:hypothetical protein
LTCLRNPDDDAQMNGDNELDPREAERLRRRDRDAAAEERALMKPGMGKVFKQIQDAQRKAADAVDSGDPAAAAPRGRARRRPQAR